MGGAERRTTPRLSMDFVIEYSDMEEFCQDYVRNISRGGLFIESRRPMPLGTKVQLKFSLPGRVEPIETAGEVSWIVSTDEAVRDGSAPGMGVRFRSLSEHDLAVIDQLVRMEMAR